MKKLLILLLTMAMVLTSFTACGGNENDKPVTDDQTGQVEQSGEDSGADADVEEEPGTEEDADKDAEPEDKDKTETSKPSAPSKDNNSSENNKKDEPSKEPAKEPAKPAAPSGSPSDIIEKIYAKKTVELPLGTTELDLSDGEMFTAVTGLASSDKVKEAAYSESMIGSQAYSMVVVRVKKSKDAAAVADEMLNGINPAKWICVEADDVRVAAYDDLVMLIMVSSQLEETVTGKEIVSAFKKVCGGSLDVSKKR